MFGIRPFVVAATKRAPSMTRGGGGAPVLAYSSSSVAVAARRSSSSPPPVAIKLMTTAMKNNNRNTKSNNAFAAVAIRRSYSPAATSTSLASPSSLRFRSLSSSPTYSSSASSSSLYSSQPVVLLGPGLRPIHVMGFKNIPYHRGGFMSSPLNMNNHRHHLGSVTYFSSWPGGNRGGGGRGNRMAQGLGLVGAASVLFGKTKYVFAALKLTKMASLGSMILSIGTYSMFFGLPYAAGMVGLIAVHETGHALAMMQRGIPFSPMVFVPFVGASVAMNKMPRDAWEDAIIAFAGPALGSAGAAAVAVGANLTQSQLLFALADFGYMINLFNLFPLGMMDGGRITGALSPYAGVVGVGLGGLMAYGGAIHNPIFYLILIMGTYETFMRFYDPYGRVPPNYYKITNAQRAVLTGGYFGLIGALVVAMNLNRRHQKPPEVLMHERALEKSWDMT